MSRLRVVAGPNGSGKSSVFDIVKNFKENGKVIWTGPFVNADQIEKSFVEIGRVELKNYGITESHPSLLTDYLKISTLNDPYGPELLREFVTLEANCIKLKSDNSSPRLGMIVSDLIREELLRRQISFTMETVFSNREKLNFMRRANAANYKVYLYFVSTEDPQINIRRVEGRVADGGHDVPKDKIVSRYARTMENLYDAVKLSYRAYIFDNSGSETIKLAEKDKDGTIHLEERVPQWILKNLRIQ